MKVLIVLLVIVIALVAILYQSFTGFDPAKQAEEFVAAVKPGMTWTELAAINEPQVICELAAQIEKDLDGNDVIVGYRQGFDIKYDQQKVTDRIKSGSFPHGFIMEYRFAGDLTYQVTINKNGKVDHVEKMMTMKDLPIFQ